MTLVGFEPTTASQQNSLGNCDGHPLRFTRPKKLIWSVIFSIRLRPRGKSHRESHPILAMHMSLFFRGSTQVRTGDSRLQI